MSFTEQFLTLFRKETYITVNASLAVIILIIFVYFALFSPAKNNYPFTCIHEELTGEPCLSCGLSHSFSLIIKGRITEAYDWNPNGIRIFLFFLGQLFFRVVFSYYYIVAESIRKQLIIYDITGSCFMFLLSFLPFITYLF
ncbi:MAG TPA: DUF2752 domain-containing protein [Bacteroidales bacterium]|nr:DUF2752 domain-containing protein [Bacteroidales bacterium]HQG35928.1 DUF2752 domain-containing protein [Bacteroidales bacterium]HQG53641.1 DUF2752 domain-containing protein [Bacteroidales bacterium]HQJ20922.1 DUF2752 domain-containing protein [Bacteroidales bacterium]